MAKRKSRGKILERLRPLLDSAVAAHPGILLVEVGLYEGDTQFGFCLARRQHRRAERLYLDGLQDMEIKKAVDFIAYQFEFDMIRENFPTAEGSTEWRPLIEDMIGMDDPNGQA